MEEKNIIEIDLLHFLRTGEFNIIRLGQTKNWILENFPEPDNCIPGLAYQEASIWRYGDIEFHFDKNELFLICTESFKNISGGKSLKIINWLDELSQIFTLEFIIKHLNSEKIDFELVNDKMLKNYVRLTLLESGVKMTFIGEIKFRIIKNRNRYRLAAISLIQK